VLRKGWDSLLNSHDCGNHGYEARDRETR